MAFTIAPSGPVLDRSAFPLVFLGALALFLGHANPLLHIPLLTAVYPAALYLLGMRDATPFHRGWLTGLLGASACLYWISVAIHDYGNLPWVMAVAGTVLLGAYVGLWGGIFCKAVSLLKPLPPWRRWMACVLLWYLLEWTRSWFLTGFPWLSLASGQAAWPLLIQSASLYGEYFLSAVYAGVGIALAQAWADPQKSAGLKYAALGIMLLCAVLAFGFLRLGGPDASLTPKLSPALSRQDEHPALVRLTLIQGNMRQDQKWDAAYQQATVDKYLDLSRRALAEQAPARPDAVIWPETAMPFYFQANAELAPRLGLFAAENGTALIFGAPGYYRPPPSPGERREASVFNRAFYLDANGVWAGYYDKQHLVPFGEYVPPGFNLKIFASLMQGVGGFTPGEDQPPFVLSLQNGRSASLGMLICYEAIFPEIARASVAQGAQILVNISNDAWYNRTSAPIQHLHLSLMRAVEQGRWLARGTNTGLTAFVDPKGRVTSLGDIASLSGLFMDGSLSLEIPTLDGHTPFFHLQARLPLLALGVILLILFPLTPLRKRFPWHQKQGVPDKS